ncbi:hypothetical protein L218DRAFT_44521 [Marasmius fiardii PR-910]|nr:hypothetical protein L218DRAFT_44521 [Marasmius fiardii PR-910]
MYSNDHRPNLYSGVRQSTDQELEDLASRVRESASRFKQLFSGSTSVTHTPFELFIPALQLNVPQSFFSTIDNLNLPHHIIQFVKHELEELVSSYSEQFTRTSGQLAAMSTHPTFKASLPTLMERLRQLLHTRFETMKSFILEKAIAYSEQHTNQNEIKRPFNHAYTPVLEKYFEFNERPSAADQAAMAEKSGMSRRQIEVWFQNRRRRMKRQFGDNRTPRHCPGFSDENITKLQRGLPEYLLQTGTDNPVDFVERVVSAEWEEETRDLRQEKKYSSFHQPRYPRDLHAPNPLDAQLSDSDLPSFKPSQFQDLMKCPRNPLPEPQWTRRPYVPPLSVPQLLKKPRGRAAQIANASPQPEPPSEMEVLTKRFDEDFHIDNSGVPEEFRVYYFGRGPHLPPAATYAKDVRPPAGRHPAFVVPGSKEIPGGLLPPPAVIPTKRKKAGLPKRTPKNPQRRVANKSSPTPSSRSPSPPSTSRTPSLSSSISSSSPGLRRHSSVSSFSDPDSPLFSPVNLPCELPQVAVAGVDPISDLESDPLSLLQQEGMKINFPFGFEAFTQPSEASPAKMPLFDDIFRDTFAVPVTLPQAFELPAQQLVP